MRGKSWKAAAALAALAITFNLVFIRWATDHVVTRISAAHAYSVTHTIQATPLNVWSFSVFDLMCVRLPFVAASALVSGLYPRDGASLTASALLGMILPDILLTAAAVFLLDGAVGKWRKISGVIVVVLGLTVVALFGVLLLMFTAKEDVSRNSVALVVPLLIVLTGLALTVIGTRAFFTRR